MGVSAAGKTTVARALAQRLGWAFTEGDAFHPAANVRKMRVGEPLTDDDRWPWLHVLADWIGRQEAAGLDVVLTCSALKRAYRDLLRDGHPSVRFVHLTVDDGKLQDRIADRPGHFMPPALLTSQLEALEPLTADEGGLTLPGDRSPTDVVDALVARL